MYLCLGAALSTPSFVSLFCKAFADVFGTLVFLSAILLPSKSPVASAVFWIDLFDAVFIASFVDFFALSRPNND